MRLRFLYSFVRMNMKSGGRNVKTYRDLDLKKIRELCDLDFARHTYGRGQCSCCYGPMDMGNQWWTEGRRPKRIPLTDNKGNIVFGKYRWSRDPDTITYILFKNADNGRGHIRSLNAPIRDRTCIEYHFSSDEQKMKVCRMLQEQLGEEYEVVIPNNPLTCIVIHLKSEHEEKEEHV